MRSNRGQVLIVFVLFLPVLIMLAGLIIDVGYLFISKREVDYVVKDAVHYGLLHLDEEDKVRELVTKNVDDIDNLSIDIEVDSITISLEKKQMSLFTVIFSKYHYSIETTYYGYKKDGKIVIRKE